MARWNEAAIMRLHRMHTDFVNSLRFDVASVNDSLGLFPPDAKLQPLTLHEFRGILLDDSGDSEAKRLWLLRIGNNEAEFPLLQDAG